MEVIMFHRTFLDTQWHTFFQRVLREACRLSSMQHPPPLVLLVSDAIRSPRQIRFVKEDDQFIVRSDLINLYSDSYERLHGTEATERQLVTHAFMFARWRLHLLGVPLISRDCASISVGTRPVPITLKRAVLSDDVLRSIERESPGQNTLDARVTALIAVYYAFDQDDLETARECLSA